MHKEEKVKKVKHKLRSKNKSDAIVPVNQRVINIKGINHITLNTITQKIVGCVVGQHVTTENPWIFIKKELIEDNLELHEHSSDFLPVLAKIKAYSEEEILVGYDKPVGKDVENFFICTTVKAKNITLELLAAEKLGQQELLNNKIQRVATTWKSLGSELEVDDLIVKPFRPQLSTEIQFELSSIKFKDPLVLRLAEQVKTGYIEILPGQYISNHILRRKSDAAIQSCPEVASKLCQTIQTHNKNKVTQYEYTYKEVKYELQADNIANFFRCNKAHMIYELDINQYFNLYHNEYYQLKNNEILNDSFKLKSIISFKDEIYCSDIKVSALTWHPLISGIIAAAYIINPAHQVINKETEFNCEKDELGAHLVLIWCETDPYRPKIYLRSPRAVNCLLFCPTNYDLLLGGLSSGQIIIWDLTNKLYEVERKEILTHEEAKHRVIVQSYVSWIKDMYDKNEINRPTVVSSLFHSHTESVTGLSWLQPEYKFGKLGHVTPNPQDKNVQFFSSGMDSIIYVWDLNQRAITSEEVIERKKRFRPSDILVDQSPFRRLDTHLRPFYKIVIQNPSTNNFLPISVINFHATNYVYKKIEENEKRIYFEHVLSDKLMEFKPQFVLATALGGIITGSWSGLPFNQGVKLHSEDAKINKLSTIHDGPITVCSIHPVYTNYFLTVGGKVFAAWNIENIALPLYWRKSSQRYISGVWSPNHLFAVLIARQDLTYQLWNLVHKYNRNRFVVKSMDSTLMALYSEYGKDHVTKGNIATTNLIGSIRIFQFPILSSIQVDLLKNAKETAEKILVKREKILMDLFKKGNKIQLAAPTLDEVVSEPLLVSQDLPKIEQKKSGANPLKAKKYREPAEQYVYESVLKRHRINVADIQNQEKPVKSKLKSKLGKEKKIKMRVNKREEIFENAKKFVMKKKFECKHRRYIKISFSEEEVSYIKNNYLISYKIIEDISLQVIKRRPFRYIFDWNEMINKTKL